MREFIDTDSTVTKRITILQVPIENAFTYLF